MANSGLKLAALMLIVSGAISAFNAVGVMAAPTGVNNYNINQQTWFNVTTGSEAGVSDSSGIQANYNQYSNAGSQAISNFIVGTVYAKGIVDSYFPNNWVAWIFTGFIQSILYFAAIIGSLSWLLNKYVGI